MYTIRIETGFTAAHQLELPDGSKEPSHSHDWRVVVQLSCEKLNKIALVFDFHRLRSIVDEICSELSRNPLEKLEYFARNNPSAENVAHYVYEKLKPRLPQRVNLDSVFVMEEPGCWAGFSE